MNRFSTCLAAALLALSTSAASALPVVNGSFEDIGNTRLNGSGWAFFDEIPGWKGDPKGEVQSAPTLGHVDAFDGQYYVELDTFENSTIYQDVSLAAGTYLLSFFYNPRVKDASQGTNDMTFAVGDVLSGAVRGAPNADAPFKTWTEITAEFTVEAADIYRLSFTGAGAENEANGCGDCGALLDLVSISPVPLPASLLFLLAGLGGLGVLRKRAAAA